MLLPHLSPCWQMMVGLQAERSDALSCYQLYSDSQLGKQLAQFILLHLRRYLDLRVASDFIPYFYPRIYLKISQTMCFQPPWSLNGRKGDIYRGHMCQTLYYLASPQPYKIDRLGFLGVFCLFWVFLGGSFYR